MPKTIGRLTALKVGRTLPAGMYADGAGLYLQVTGNGAKSWIFRFSIHGKAREMGLGSFAAVSLADARAKAAACRTLRQDGVDPIEARKVQHAQAALDAAKAITFKEAAERYIASHRTGWKVAKHASLWENTLSTYAYPVIGKVSVQAVDTSLVLRILEPIWNTKPETAGRVRGRIEAIIDWAKSRGLRQGENPARWRGHLQYQLPARSKVRRVKHHAALPYAELPNFVVALREEGGIGARALEFAILTAARTGEIIGATRDEANTAEKVWTVPAARMKAGREHRVPLSSRAGPTYQPKTTPGEYAGAVASFLPAALGGEGGAIRRAAQVVVPAVAGQGAGDAAAAAGVSPGVQDAIKVAASIGAGVPLSVAGAGPVNQAVAAAERQGITIPKYMATDGSILPKLAQGAKAVPFGGAPVVKSATAVSKGLEDAISTIAPNTPADVAGNAAKSALVQNIKVDAPADLAAKYTAVENLMTNPGARVPLTNTAQKMQDLMTARANANLPEWSPAMQQLASAVTDPKGMGYAGIKLLRTYLSKSVPQQLVAEGIDPTTAKQLYGPLTQDLQSAVGAAGGQPALNAWQEANTLAAANVTQRKQLYSIIGAKADAPPEAVFGRLVQLAGTRSTADISLLQQAKQAMGPQAWQQVGDAIVSRLGRNPQGDFSADRFIGPNGYAGLSPSAKSVLFTPQQKAALDDLNIVSNQVNEKISKYTNSSKTADVSKAAELLGGLWIHPTGTIAAIAGTRGAAYLLSRPAVAQAAVRLGRAQLAGSAARTALAHTALVNTIQSETSTAGQQ